MSTQDANNTRLKTFGANVRRARSSRTLTQERLAELADLNVRTIQKIEAGETNILITTLARIARALDVETDLLLKGV